MNAFITRQALICLIAFCGLSSAYNSAHGADIVLVNNDGSSEGFNDPSPAMDGQVGNTGQTLGEQRLQVFQAAADYWEERLVINVDVRVGINFDPLNCSAGSATLGSAGADGLFRNFDNAPRSNTLYVAAVANNLAGRRLARDPNSVDINARFNSSIDNNDSCLRGTNWWMGINSPAPRGTISLFDTVLHEIGHGLGVASGVRQDGRLLAGTVDAYSFYLYDETRDQFWRDMNDNERATSAINTGNVTFRGPNVENNSSHITTGKNDGHLRVFAPNPYRNGSSISHWDTALVPDELMEPSATPTSDDRATLQMLKDLGWGLTQDQGGGPGPTPVVGTISWVTDNLTIVEDQGPLTINLQRSGGTDGAVSVRIRSSGITATANQDYTVINEVVSWADGESGIKTVQLIVADDGTAEGNETLDVRLTEATGGVNLGNLDVRVTISDPAVTPPPPTPGRVEFRATTQSVNEGAGTINVQVQRVNGSDGRLEIDFDFFDNTAQRSSDYTTPSSTRIVWSDGQSGVRNLSLSIIDDNVVEGNEVTELALRAITSGATVSSNRLRLTINDNDQNTPAPTPGRVEFILATQTVDEGAGTVNVRVQRINGDDGRLEVDFDFFDTTALNQTDYSTQNSTRVIWLDGQSGVRNLPINIIDDDLVEDDEFTELLIQAITSGANISPNRLRLIITDNDQSTPITPPAPEEEQEEFDVLGAIVPILGTISARKAAAKRQALKNQPSE